MKMDWAKPARLAKPCPFCGSKKIVTESREHFEASKCKTCTNFQCTECGAMLYSMPVRSSDGWFSQDYNVVQRKALKMWNRRAKV